MSKTTLLGELATRFAHHPEDLATESLWFIITQSTAVKQRLITFFASWVDDPTLSLTFRTQDSATDAEGRTRPDLVGVDYGGRQRIIVEAKFWAGLTDAQPVGYLDRLPADESGLLVFVAPQARADLLWDELLRRCQAAGRTFVTLPSKSQEYRLVRIGEHAALGLTSWAALLAALRSAAENAEDRAAADDLAQLDGLCQRMDDQAFLPVRSEELAPEIGRRFFQFCQLADVLTGALEREHLADRRGLRKGKGPGFYGQYLLLKGWPCFLHVSAWRWGHVRETPLWLELYGHNWKFSQELHDILSGLAHEQPCRLIVVNGDQLLVPLYVRTGIERDAVLEDLAAQVRHLASRLPARIEPAAEGAPPEEA
jgi:hypothetical protein